MGNIKHKPEKAENFPEYLLRYNNLESVDESSIQVVFKIFGATILFSGGVELYKDPGESTVKEVDYEPFFRSFDEFRLSDTGLDCFFCDSCSCISFGFITAFIAKLPLLINGLDGGFELSMVSLASIKHDLLVLDPLLLEPSVDFLIALERFILHPFPIVLKKVSPSP